MATQKPAALPPDTAHAGGAASPGVLQDARGHISAKSPESLDSSAPAIRRTQGPITAARTHLVIFTVFHDGIAICFLSELLIALQAVDSTAKILPHLEAHSAYVPLGRIKDIPTDSSVKNFVKAYLAGLKMS